MDRNVPDGSIFRAGISWAEFVKYCRVTSTLDALFDALQIALALKYDGSAASNKIDFHFIDVREWLDRFGDVANTRSTSHPTNCIDDLPPVGVLLFQMARLRNCNCNVLELLHAGLEPTVLDRVYDFFQIVFASEHHDTTVRKEIDVDCINRG